MQKMLFSHNKRFQHKLYKKSASFKYANNFLSLIIGERKDNVRKMGFKGFHTVGQLSENGMSGAPPLQSYQPKFDSAKRHYIAKKGKKAVKIGSFIAATYFFYPAILMVSFPSKNINTLYFFYTSQPKKKRPSKFPSFLLVRFGWYMQSLPDCSRILSYSKLQKRVLWTFTTCLLS